MRVFIGFCVAHLEQVLIEVMGYEYLKDVWVMGCFWNLNYVVKVFTRVKTDTVRFFGSPRHSV